MHFCDFTMVFKPALAAKVSSPYKIPNFPVEDKDWRQEKCLRLRSRDQTAVLNWKVSKQELDWERACLIFPPSLPPRDSQGCACWIRPSERNSQSTVLQYLRHLRENIQQKQPKPVHAKVPLCATTQRIENTFGHSNIIIAHHLRHSAVLATCEFLQFHKMKIKFKGQCFDALEEIQHASQMHSWNGNGLNNLKISLTLEAGEDNLEGEIFLLTFF